MKKMALSLTAAMLAILFIFSACGVGKRSNATVLRNFSSVSSETKNKTLCFSDTEMKNLRSVSKKGMTELFFDEKTFSVCVYDHSSGKLWRSLPEKETDKNACVLSVNVIVGNKEYLLNSQSDSVAEGNAEYKIESDGLTVSFRFKKTLGENADVDLTVPVKFTDADGTLTASIDLKNVSVSGAVLKRISLLGFFGADESGKGGDYILIPDGCGAIIDTAGKAEKFKRILLPVYGGDPSLDEKTSAVYVPAFGKRNGESAFFALIESADAISKINAEKALKTGGLNRVWADFEITPSVTEGKKTLLSKSSYDGLVSVCYRFLSGDNANYVSMASACRELLIRSSVFSMNETEFSKTEGFPLSLTLIASAKGEKTDRKGGEQKVLTSLSQAKDVISFLRSKGIKNITLRIKGLFEGGLVQTGFSSVKLFSSLGTKKELEEFMDFSKSQNVSVYADVGLFSASSPGADSAVKIGGGKTAISEPLENSSSSFENSFRLLPENDAEKNSDRLIALLLKTGFDGISLSDAGKILYSDFSSGKSAGRTKIKAETETRCGALSSGKKLMTSGGNVYALKYASFANDLWYTAKCAENEFCTAVPFVQSILHGVVDYSHTAFNRAKNGETAFLKAVEYGAVPSWEWYFENFGTDEEEDGFYYMNKADDARRYYERMSEVFSDLRNKKITAHRKLKSGVFCTEYGSSVRVYVNYNKKDVSVGGVTVEGKSFVRVG